MVGKIITTVWGPIWWLMSRKSCTISIEQGLRCTYVVNPIKRSFKLLSNEYLELKLIFCIRYWVCEQFGANSAGIMQKVRVDNREVVRDECNPKHGEDLYTKSALFVLTNDACCK